MSCEVLPQTYGRSHSSGSSAPRLFLFVQKPEPKCVYQAVVLIAERFPFILIISQRDDIARDLARVLSSSRSAIHDWRRRNDLCHRISMTSDANVLTRGADFFEKSQPFCFEFGNGHFNHYYLLAIILTMVKILVDS
jgi:hypothetical protein